MRIAPFVLAVAAGCGFQSNPGAGDAGGSGTYDGSSGSGGSGSDASPIDGDMIDSPAQFDPGAPIAGGGVGGGAIAAGTLAVYVIETYTNAPLANATVELVDGGSSTTAAPAKMTTDGNGLAVFTGVVGTKVTVGATLPNHRSALWVGVTGAHVTLSLVGPGPATGMLSATSGDVTIPPPKPGHTRAIHGVAVSAPDDFLISGVDGLIPNTQGGAQCSPGGKTCTLPTLTTRTGKVAVAMAVIDNGNAFADYQFATDVDIAATGTATATLTPAAPADLVDATVDTGGMPGGLAPFAFVGFQLPNDGTLLYATLGSTLSPLKVPKLMNTFATAKYRALVGGVGGGNTSFVLLTQTATAFKPAAWLVPADKFAATAHDLSYSAVPDTAQMMSMIAGGLQVVILDGSLAVTYPPDFAATGTATLYALHATPAVDAANFGFAADGATFDELSSASDDTAN